MMSFARFLGLVAASIGLTLSSPAQTVGLQLQTEDSYDGYTLMPVTVSEFTYLINNCGEEVHSWQSDYKAGMMAYLLDDGSLMRAGRTNNTTFSTGGAGGILEKFSWEGELLWSYLISSETICQHHDFAVLPNGNVLALAWKSYPGEAWIAQGRDPEKTFDTVWGTYIVEIEPVGATGGNVVWRWEAIDHLVQDFDDTKPHFGDPANFPRKLDVNYAATATDVDWLHTNSIAYHPDLDQIIVSSRDFSEFWILDHGTTTQEAKGPAGDLMYRWGNPEAYGRGTEADRILFNQHDARWIDDGQIMVFSNGNERPAGNFSTVEVMTPPLNADGTYNLDPGAPWGPEGADWRYPSVLDANFFSQNTSGAHQLPNGNILITEGASGELREVTLGQQIVWNYVNPVGVFGPTPQGNVPLLNAVFRAERYAAAHPGLAGRNLEGQGVLEITDEVVQCQTYPEPTCAADLNGNYLVDVSDLLSVLAAFGCNLLCPQDLNGNGAVGVDDVLFILSEVGHPCPY